MEDKSYSIILADGTVLDGLRLNGNTFVSTAPIDASVFAGNCSPVTISDGENEEVHDHMEPVPCAQPVEGEYWFVLRGLSAAELREYKSIPRTLEQHKAVKLAELSAACNAAIVGGCDVSLSDGSSGHIALTNEDQINLTNAVTTVAAGAERYPYHLDGELCAMYPAADILAMGQAATAHKLYHTTYYNHLAAWVRRCGTVEELEAITYGAALPEDLAASMAGILAAAGA